MDNDGWTVGEYRLNELRQTFDVRLWFLRKEIHYLREAIGDEKNRAELIKCADHMAKQERNERESYERKGL